MKPSIFFFNSLNAHYGSTYRIHSLFAELKNLGLTTDYQDLPDSFFKNLKTTFTCAFKPHDIFFTQKFNPFTLIFIFIGKLRGKTVVVDWDDFDPGLQGTTLKKVLSYFCEWLGPKFPDLITSHSYVLLEKIKQKTKTMYVPQGFNPKIFFPDPQNKIENKKQFNLSPNKKTVCHLCTFTYGGTLDLEIILKAWSEIQNPNLEFLLVGGGPQYSIVFDLLIKYGLEIKVHLTGLLSQKDVARALNASDLGVVFMSDNLANQSRVSFKTLEYLACALPVVGQLVGETQKHFGNFIHSSTKDTLGRSILSQLEHPTGLPTPNLNAFHWSEITKQLAQTLSNVYK